jgi:hypothetical protein
MVLMVIGVLPGHKGRIGHHDHTHFIGQTPLERLALRPREAAFDGGFSAAQANTALPDTAVFVAGRQQPAARRSRKRLAGYRVGAEGRISHLKRDYGLRRSRLRGHDGARTWVRWGLLAYNLDTLSARAVQSA